MSNALFMAFFGFCMGGIFAIVGVMRFMGQKKMEKQTRSVLATVKEVVVTEGEEGLIMLRVEYPTEHGWFSSDMMTGSVNPNKYKVGQTVKVLYKPKNPDVPALASGGYFMLVIGLALLAVGVLGLVADRL